MQNILVEVAIQAHVIINDNINPPFSCPRKWLITSFLLSSLRQRRVHVFTDGIAELNASVTGNL